MAANERKDDLAPGEIRYTTGDGQYNTGYVKDGYVYTDKDYTNPIPTDSVVNTNGGYYRKGNYGSYAVGTPEDYKDQMQGYLYQINKRKPFQFDLNNDALYNQYKDQYTRLGKVAMEDTMGQAAGLTGGYGSTYGQAVGQQQYQAYLDRLNDVIPDIYAKQRSDYDTETNELYNRYNAANSAYGTAMDEQRYNDQLDYERSRTAQSEADERLMMFLQMGMTPSADLIAASSYSPEEVNGMKNYYAQQAALAAAGGGSGRGGSGGGTTEKDTGVNGLPSQAALDEMEDIFTTQGLSYVYEYIDQLASAGYSEDALLDYLEQHRSSWNNGVLSAYDPAGNLMTMN